MKFYPLVVSDKVSETKDAASFVLNVPDTLKATFTYAAGQYLTFEIPWKGFSIQRCYSLSSSPATGPELKFTVKRVVDGRASNWFNDHVHRGTQIMVAPPAGRFMLQGELNGPLMLFAGGSGIFSDSVDYAVHPITHHTPETYENLGDLFASHALHWVAPDALDLA